MESLWAQRPYRPAGKPVPHDGGPVPSAGKAAPTGVRRSFARDFPAWRPLSGITHIPTASSYVTPVPSALTCPAIMSTSTTSRLFFPATAMTDESLTRTRLPLPHRIRGVSLFRMMAGYGTLSCARFPAASAYSDSLILLRIMASSDREGTLTRVGSRVLASRQ